MGREGAEDGPLTAEMYVQMNWPGRTIDRLGAEELASTPEPLMRIAHPTGSLPRAPTPDRFETTEDFEEAKGYWQSYVGRIKAMADLADLAERLKAHFAVVRIDGQGP